MQTNISFTIDSEDLKKCTFTVNNSSCNGVVAGDYFTFRAIERLEGGVKSVLEELLFFSEDKASHLTAILYMWYNDCQQTIKH